MQREELLQASTLAEHRGIRDPPCQVPEAAALCGQDGVGRGGPQALETKPSAPEVTQSSFDPQEGDRCVQ